jgi:hypothetical protein
MHNNARWPVLITLQTRATQATRAFIAYLIWKLFENPLVNMFENSLVTLFSFQLFRKRLYDMLFVTSLVFVQISVKL